MKRILSLLCCLVFTHILFAQTDITHVAKRKAHSKFYFNIGLGYAMPLAGQTLDANNGGPLSGTFTYSNPYGNQPDTVHFSMSKTSFSSGMHAIAGFGYMFNDNIGLQCDISYGAISTHYTNQSVDTLHHGIRSNVSHEQYAKTPIMFTPALLIQTKVQKATVYMRAGIALPLSAKIIHNETINYYPPGNGGILLVQASREIKTNFGLGYAGALGISWAVADNVKFWAEASVLAMSLYAKEADVTSFTADGVNQMFTASPLTLKTTYSMGSTSVSNGAGDQPTYSIPFSNMSINAGLSFRL